MSATVKARVFIGGGTGYVDVDVPSGGSGVGSGAIIFRPGVASAGNAVETWPEVQDALTTADGAITVYVDSSIAPALVPGSSGITDFQGAGVLASYSSALIVSTGTPGDTLTIEDGATLHRVRSIDGPLGLYGQCTTTAALSFAYGPAASAPIDLFDVGKAATLATLPGAAVGMIQIPDASGIILLSRVGVTVNGQPGAPVIDMLGASFFVWFCFDQLTLGTDVLRGGASATVIFQHDDTIALPATSPGGPFELLAGTLVDGRTSLAQWAQPSSYAMAGRPMPPNVQTGQLNWTPDIGLGVLQVWNGVMWMTVGGGAGVVGVTATAPLTSSGGVTPDIAIEAGVGGDILYNNGLGAWAHLTVGAAGQVLMAVAGPTFLQWSDVVLSVTGGDAIDITGTAQNPIVNLFLAGEANGDLIYFNGAAWARVPIGTPAQVLTVVGGVPTWQTPPASVTSVTATAPLQITGAPTTPNVEIAPGAQGDILYFDGVDWVRLPAGAAGQVLTTEGVAPNSPQWVTPSGGGTPPFFDNAVARRTTSNAYYRRNGQLNAGLGVIHASIPNIPALVDGTGQNTGGTQFYALQAGAGMAVIGDNVYVTGNDGAGATASNGQLYGFNKLTQLSLTALNTPLHQYGGVTAATAACPNALVASRVTVNGVDSDYIFAANQKTCELGILTQTFVPGDTYTPVYTTTFVPEFRATSAYQGAVQAICINRSPSADPSTPPWFAFVDSNAAAALWTVSPTGVVTPAFSPSALHLFAAMCIDDDGFVWAVEYGGGSALLHKLSISYGTGTFTAVAVMALTGGNNLTPYDVQSDGRSICVLSVVSPTGVQIQVVDRIALTTSRIITLPGAPSAPINLGYPTRMAFDGTAMWVGIGEAGTSDSAVHVYCVQTESGEVFMDLGPYAPGNIGAPLELNRSITVADDGTVLLTVIDSFGRFNGLALVYTSTNVPTVHARSLALDDGLYASSPGYVPVYAGLQSEQSGGTAPTITRTGGITAAAFVGTPNQTAGQVSLTSNGTAGTAQVVFGVSVPGGVPLKVVLTPTDAAAAGAAIYVTSSANTFTINVPIVAAGTLTWNYICVG